MSSDIARQRAEIEDEIAGRTLCDELRQLAETAGDAGAYSDEAGTGAGDGWHTLTWAQARQRVLETAAAFVALGLAPAERVALMLPNRSEHVLADLGAVHAGGLGVTLYPTLAPEQVAYVAGDCDARMAVLDGAAELDRWRTALDRLPGIKKVIVRDPSACPADDRYMTWADLLTLGQERLAADPSEIEARIAAITPDDPLALLYTSGTTGNPKGAVLTHGNLLATVEATDAVIPHRQHRIVSLLPLSHLFGVLELYYGLHGSAPILYVRSRNPRVIFEAIRAHQVTTMVVVPQLLDLFWAALTREVARLGRTATFERARRIGRHLPYAVRRWLFRSIHAQLGGGLTLFICAAAFLPPALQEAWEEIGVVVVQGFGSTECGFATANHPGDHDPGTVGRPMPPARVRIDPSDGEVQVAGPTVFQGYWRDPAATAAAFTDDGWYRTGDVGRWDDRGSLVLSGRLKDMIALPNGMKVYPEDIENALRVAGLGDTVVLETAPGRIEAVVLPPGAALAIAPGAPTPPARPRSAAEVAALRATVDQAVKAANAALGMHQRVVAWRFWPEPDFPRTHTLKVRRDTVRAWVQTDPHPVPATS